MKPYDVRAVLRLAALPLGPHRAGMCWRCGGAPYDGVPRRPGRQPVCAPCAWAFLVKGLWPREAERAVWAQAETARIVAMAKGARP